MAGDSSSHALGASRHTVLLLASSNPGKVVEFRALAADSSEARAVPSNPPSAGESSAQFTIELLPRFDELAAFPEDAPTFAENAAGKALHYSRFVDKLVFADDSGLVVPALGGAPGVRSARYAGEHATNAERIAKLLNALRGLAGDARNAHFVCAIALAREGRVLAVITNRVDGQILAAPRGAGGFGYDPVFYFPPLQKTFAELTAEQKNGHSHRGKAFCKLLRTLKLS